MNPFDIIDELYGPNSRTRRILLKHGKQVADKAIHIARKISHLKPDLNFIKEAAILHDIGIFMTHAPELGCLGEYPYVCHGYLGRGILEKKGLPTHALVCERHVGVGITAEEIKRYNLPLPHRDMVPVSIEEQIICFADKFFSKNGNMYPNEKSVEDVFNTLRQYGPDKMARFQSWVTMFET